ncbi:MAG: ABC transporter substrate-binding protein [Synergistaceae bacterium]|jgi:NitT/TauT family transport system substrate-binding protein|nr:ABC transporter substrate-binding protein [Synergistaceae bacterium]
MKKIVLTALFFFVFSQAAFGTDAKLEQSAFSLGHLNSTAHLLGFVAAEEGFFKEEGLDVTLTQLSSAGELVAGLESNKLDAAFVGSVPAVTFQSQGRDVTVFGGAMSNGHGYVIKSEFTKGLKKWDIGILKGRNVASVKNSVQDYELLVLLKNAGLEPGKDVNVVYFDSQRDAYTALQSKEIDAASVYSPYASLARGAGHEVVYYCSEVEIFKDQPCCRQLALTSALKAKPNTYKAFERALIKAYKFSRENREKTIDNVKKYIDIDRNYIEYEVYGGHSASKPDPDKQATVALKKGIVEFGYTKDYDIEPLYDTVLYKEALGSLIAENPGDAIYRELLEHFVKYE